MHATKKVNVHKDSIFLLLSLKLGSGIANPIVFLSTIRNLTVDTITPNKSKDEDIVKDLPPSVVITLKCSRTRKVPVRKIF